MRKVTYLVFGLTFGACLLLPSGRAVAGKTSGVVRVCPQLAPDCDFTSLSKAAEALVPGGTMIIAAGDYFEGAVIATDHATFLAEPGAHLKRALVADRAALLVTGQNVVIDGLECSEISGPFRNGACVRAEGRNITLRHVYFHDSEEGLIATDDAGDIVIEDSLFANLGGADGHAHAIYINKAASFELRRSRILSSRGTGHEVKSRAARTLIEDSVIAGLSGVDSRQVDISNGGIVVIRRSILEKGPNSTETDVIGYGLEGESWSSNSLTIDDCVIIMDGARSRVIRSVITPIMQGNEIVENPASGGIVRFVLQLAHAVQPSRFGDSIAWGSGGRWYSDRAAAQLADFPALPEHRPIGSP